MRFDCILDTHFASIHAKLQRESSSSSVIQMFADLGFLFKIHVVKNGHLYVVHYTRPRRLCIYRSNTSNACAHAEASFNESYELVIISLASIVESLLQSC